MPRERRKTQAMLAVEAKYGRPIDDVLKHLYVGEGRSMAGIGWLLGVSPSTIWFWMLKFGIPSRRWMLPGEP
jgi:hypothetical protein